MSSRASTSYFDFKLESKTTVSKFHSSRIDGLGIRDIIRNCRRIYNSYFSNSQWSLSGRVVIFFFFWVLQLIVTSMAYSSHRRNMSKTSSHELVCRPANHVPLQLIQNQSWVPHTVSHTRLHPYTVVLRVLFSTSPSQGQISPIRYNKYVSLCIIRWTLICMLYDGFCATSKAQNTMFTSLSLIYYFLNIIYWCRLGRMSWY
jgi:hypothetical protein